MNNIQKELFSMQDLGYKEFHSRLIPNINPDTIIGVRTPELRKYARSFARQPEAEEFLNTLPHKYYEENNLHAFLVETIKDYDKALFETERFLPFIDNWATCDMFLPKVFKKHTDTLIFKIKEWLKSSHTYTVRYGTGLLMSLYLDEHFSNEYLELVSAVRSDEYYINMMLAWYFATALAKQYDAAIPYIEEKKLDKWVHNKAIQKAIESRRIDNETKLYLRGLKIK